MEQKMYNVYLYYHGCVNERVAAFSEREAVERLRQSIEQLSCTDFCTTAGIIEDGSDAYEIGEVIDQ